MIFAPYTAYVLSCYGIAFLLLGGYGLHIFLAHRNLKQRLEQVEGASVAASSKWLFFKSKWVFAVLPLLFFAGLIVLFASRLDGGQNKTDLPSALVGKALPSMDLPPLEGLKTSAGVAIGGINSASMVGDKVSVLNVFASWCGPCRAEHPFIMQLSKNPQLRVVGLNYKDKPENALNFLTQHGNPYVAVGVDAKGRTALDLGVYGVPETFLVSKEGRILHRFTGPIDEKRLQNEVLPQIEKALK